MPAYIKSFGTPTLHLLRVAQVRLSFCSGLLTLLRSAHSAQVCSLCSCTISSIFNEGSQFATTVLRTIHNLCQPELIPRQLSPSACQCMDVICVFPIAARYKNVHRCCSCTHCDPVYVWIFVLHPKRPKSLWCQVENFLIALERSQGFTSLGIVAMLGLCASNVDPLVGLPNML